MPIFCRVLCVGLAAGRLQSTCQTENVLSRWSVTSFMDLDLRHLVLNLGSGEDRCPDVGRPTGRQEADTRGCCRRQPA